jgi:8-oxo-dGTP pyrophosphatase MutT (NUDIX family)
VIVYLWDEYQIVNQNLQYEEKMKRDNNGLLKQKLQQTLPGLPSQLKMAPPNRAEQLKQDEKKMLSARQSAVMVLLFHDEGALKTVFIKRSEYDGVHSGQISFPGGQFEKFDSSFEATAIRETNEEIGVKKSEIELIGKLTELYIPPSNFMVKVFVGYCARKPEYTIDKREVQRVIEVEINSFYPQNAKKQMEIISSTTGLKTMVPCYEVNDIRIWGATAMIVSELIDILTNENE